MDGTHNYLRRSTFLALNGLVAGGYVGLAIWSGGRLAIEIYNAFLFGAAAGVVVAYLLPAWRAIRHPYLSGGHMLRIGIFMSWSAVLLARSVSIVWRFSDQPPAWLDSVAWGFHIPGSLMAAYAHIISPEALDGRVPTRAMTTWGFRVMFAATAVALLFVVGDGLDWWGSYQRW